MVGQIIPTTVVETAVATASIPDATFFCIKAILPDPNSLVESCSRIAYMLEGDSVADVTQMLSISRVPPIVAAAIRRIWPVA